MTLTGGCLCGAVRYLCEAEPLWVCHCHCEMCRRHSGAPVATFVGFPAGTVRWLGTEPKRYRTSKDVERSFCAACGSSIGFHRVHEPSLYLGSFDAPSELPVADIWTLHTFYKDHIAWFDTADAWERHSERSPGRTEELTALSGSQSRDRRGGVPLLSKPRSKEKPRRECDGPRWSG